ncbi:MAG: hypothetical protein ACFCUP_00615 [Actinomycetales bacterium]
MGSDGACDWTTTNYYSSVRHGFVQRGEQGTPVPGPLHRMLAAHDERALELFLLHRALVSAEPWTSRPLDSRVWARALGLHNDAGHGVTAVSKTWRRLADTYRLVERGRSGRLSVITSLREDGSGKPYTSPSGGTRAERYFTLPFEYWASEERWYRTLTFPAKVMLLIGSTLKPGFVMPTEKARDWYGVSTESAERGLRVLRERGLLERTTTVKDAPLSPAGKTQEYHYTLHRPFGRLGRPKLTVVSTAAS